METDKESKTLIPKSLAATEILNRQQKAKMMGIIAIAGYLIVMLLYIFSFVFGAIGLIALVVYIGLQVYNINKDIEYLSKTYGTS